MSPGVRDVWQTAFVTVLGAFAAILILYCCQTFANLVCAIFIALTVISLSPSHDRMHHRQHTQGERGGTRYIRNTFCCLCDKFCVSVNADAMMAVYLTTGNSCVDDSVASLFLWDSSRRALCVV